MIHIIDDDVIMSECIANFVKPQEAHIFTNVIDAIAALNDEIPDLIFLDVLLDGPDGFTYLNEIASYSETEKIPIVLVTSMNLPTELSSYGVVKVLDKSTMTPVDIRALAKKYTPIKKPHTKNLKAYSS